MNQGMRAGLALLVRWPFYMVVFWLILNALNSDDGFITIFLCVTPVLIAIFLSSWFGLLLKRDFTIFNTLKYYSLSIVLGATAANAMILIFITGVDGIQKGIEEYTKLWVETQILIVLSTVFVMFTLLFTTASLFEKQEAPNQNCPPETK